MPSHTTAGKLATELKSFSASLSETSEQLSAEISNIKKSEAEIQEEYDTTAKTFMKNTLPELTGEKFDAVAGLAEKTPELAGQGLTFYRQKLLDAREHALQAVEIADAEAFQSALKMAKEGYDGAEEKIGAADGVTNSATTDLDTWEKTAEYEFVALEEQIKAKGKPALTPENQAYYDPTNLGSATLNWFKRDETYKAVRKALVKYGQGEDGINIFADMVNHRKKTEDLKKAVTDAKAAAQAVRTQYASVEQTYKTLSGVENDIKPDGQILGLIQDKAASYLSTPEFAKAVSDQYSEDFPHSIPLMSAKLVTLAKLEEGAQAKMTALSANLKAANAQYKKAKGLDSDTEIKFDLDAYKQQNAAQRDAYNNYTRATNESWNRTTTYAPPQSTVYVNQSPSFLQTLILAEILSSNIEQSHSHDTPASTVPYSADLLGVSKASAANLGLPDSVFDILPAGNAASGTAAPDDAFNIISSGLPSVLDQHLSQQISDAVDAEVERAAREARESASTSNSFNIGSSGTTADDSFSFGGSSTPSSSPTEKFDI